MCRLSGGRLGKKGVEFGEAIPSVKGGPWRRDSFVVVCEKPEEREGAGEGGGEGVAGVIGKDGRIRAAVSGLWEG